jgi:recombination protein RecA
MTRRRRGEAGDGKPARLIDAVVQNIRKEEGDESSILTGGVAGATDFISTQCLALDLALNMPGLPVGRLTVVRGWESSAKTTMITHVLAETVRRGGLAVLMDAEFAFDEDRAARIGLAREDLLLAQPETIEEGVNLLERTIKAIRTETPDTLATIVWDSVGGSPTQAQIEGEFGESQAIGGHAKIMSTALKRITGVIKKENILLIIVNQNKETINTGPFSGGDTSTMIAYHPLQFHASTVIDMRKAQELRRGDKDSQAYGIMSRVKVTKNKCSSPFGKALLRCTFDTGFDDIYAHFQMGLKLGMLRKKGSWYSMADADESFHEADFGDILAANPGLREKIARAAREEFWSETVRQRFPEVT